MLVLRSLSVATNMQGHITGEDVVMELGELVQLLLDEINELDIGVKMEGMHIHVHVAFF